MPVPVGAGGDALRRIEARLAADDPDLVESFRKWRVPACPDPTDDGTMWVGGRTLLVVIAGFATIAAGFVGIIAVLLLWSIFRIWTQ